MTNSFNWRKLVEALAPTIGTALGGPFAGQAISLIADKVLGNPMASPEEVETQMSNNKLTGEQVVSLKQAENSFREKMQSLDIDVLKINQETELAYVADIADARKSNSGNNGVFWLGIAIILSFCALMGLVLFGCYRLMTGQVQSDPHLMAMCSGLIGTVVGYVASNAQQVAGYFYGSSRGSAEHGAAIASALTDTIKQAGRAT